MKKGGLHTIFRSLYLILRAAPWKVGCLLFVSIAASILSTLTTVANIA